MEKALINKNSFSSSSKAILVGSVPVVAILSGFTPNFINETKQFQYSSDALLDFTFQEVSSLQLMSISEKSLSKDWEGEDDERWNTFL